MLLFSDKNGEDKRHNLPRPHSGSSIRIPTQECVVIQTLCLTSFIWGYHQNGGG